jgi:predicted nucleic acid-binding protein
VTLIVADNSPLNLLVQLGQAEVLPKLFSEVLIPPQVAQEMRHPKAPPTVQTFLAAPPAWLTIRAPKAPASFPNLDPGESAAISLAVELRATLMVDERAGRETALAQGLLIVGAVGVLERAANDNYIPDLAAVHAQIRTLRFHVSGIILNDSLARHLAFKQSASKM